MAIFILIVLLLPKSNMPVNKLFDIKHFDKIVHALLFAGLQFLLLLDSKVQRKSYRQIFLLTFICIEYGALTELLQLLTNVGRTGSYYDFLADILGIGMGILFFWLSFGTKFQSLLRNY